jgi:hypothetical protein
MGEGSKWEGGRVRSHEDLDEADAAFWARATPSERFAASLELALTAWSLKHPNEPPPSLRVARRGGAGHLSVACAMRCPALTRTTHERVTHD